MVGKDCPFHTGIDAEITDVCRRCDEFKANEKTTWEAIDELNKELKARPMTATLIAIVGIGITLISLVCGYLFNVQSKMLDTLAAKDSVLEAELKKDHEAAAYERKEFAKELSDTKEIVIELRTLIKNGKKGWSYGK